MYGYLIVLRQKKQEAEPVPPPVFILNPGLCRCYCSSAYSNSGRPLVPFAPNDVNRTL